MEKQTRRGFLGLLLGLAAAVRSEFGPIEIGGMALDVGRAAADGASMAYAAGVVGTPCRLWTTRSPGVAGKPLLPGSMAVGNAAPLSSPGTSPPGSELRRGGAAAGPGAGAG